MASSMMRSVFDRSTEAFNRHDIRGFMDNCADDVTCAAPGGLRLQGKDAVGAFYRSWMEGFSDAHVEIRELYNVDDGMIEEGTFSGTHDGVLRTPGGDLPATGRTVRARYMQVVRFRGERIASFDLVYDRLELLEQLGMTASPGARAPERGEERTAGSV